MREQCQRKIDQLVEAFMRDDTLAYRDACAWLCQFAEDRRRAKGLQQYGVRWISEAGLRGMTERITNLRRRAHDRATRPHQKIASANAGHAQA